MKTIKKRSLSFSWLIVFALCVLVPGPGFASDDRDFGTPSAIMGDANTNILRLSMEAIGTLLTSQSMEYGPTVDRLKEIKDKYFRGWENLRHQLDMSLARHPQDADRYTAWSQEMTGFFDELEAALDVVVEWQRLIYYDIHGMERDVASFSFDYYTNSIKTMDQRIDAIRRELAGTAKLTEREVRDLLTEVTRMKNEAGSIANSLDRQVKRLEENRSIQSEMDRQVSAIISALGTMKDRYTRLDRTLVAVTSAWPDLLKKTWEDYEKGLAEFQKAFGHVMAGELFKDSTHFRGLAYQDLASPVARLETDIKTELVAATQRDKTAEEIRREIERDEELSRIERARILEIANLTGPTREWELRLDCTRAAGGLTRVRELKLIMAQNEPGSTAYDEAYAEVRLIEAENHPEQIACQRTWEDYEAEKKLLDAEYDQILRERRARKERLGIPDDMR